ncbi:hypothetical protein [Flavobacterium sp. NKUCC04_CG]|uniref:hypothetical protein n=1 Tax=Flavobacterium sp. NKUCC04_CG TaxID=2842121 RepID=UPI001C5BBBC9|nr:hypothetical protein [Flavobacterium sp. NKUCC04_CG]MBW3517662.1 hypothetical protein [Flavobacterium sp. NKUCC04_CG]
MKRFTIKNLLTLLVLFLALSSCSSDDCSSYADSPPLFLADLKFEDAETGENLFLSGKITPNDIKLIGSDNNRIIRNEGVAVENPKPTITFNLGTEHQQAKIYWEYTIHDKPAFTISFNAIETKSNSKCSGFRHYFYPDHQSLEIKDTKGVIIKEGETQFVIKI